MTHKTKKKGTGLKYIPVTDFLLIPRYLMEQIKPSDIEIDHVYAMSAEITSSPFNILGVFANKNSEVKGFLWGMINPLDMKIHIVMLSVDKEYQGKGIIPETTGILRKIMERYGLKAIVFKTMHPRLFRKYGYKQTDEVFMEGK